MSEIVTYTLTITITGTEDGVDHAYEEIIGSIEDARDSDELGDCEVTWALTKEPD